MADFTASVFQNEYLSDGATDVHAVVSVTCTGAGTAGSGSADAAEMLIIDTSGSMDMPSTQDHAPRARRPRWPSTRSSTARGSPSCRPTRRPRCASRSDRRWCAWTAGTGRAAKARDRRAAAAAGATAIGTWLMSADELFKLAPATQRHAILLTDGKIEGEEPDVLPERARASARACSSATAAASARTGASTSCARSPTALLGTVDIVAEPADLEADFEAMMRAAMGRGVAHATLRRVGAAGQRGAVRAPGRAGGRWTSRRRAMRVVAADHRGPDRGVGRRDPRLPRRRARCRRRRSATSGWPPGPRSSSTTRSSPRGSCGRCGPTTPT